MSKLSCLVTGCAGFIGSHITKILLSQNFDVVGIDDLSGGFMENLDCDLHFHKLDFTDKQAVSNLFENYNGFDYIFHIGAYAAEGLSHYIRNYNYSNNVVGSVNLINNAVTYDCKCFVFTSSIAVYGSGQTPLAESTVPLPEDPYGIAKYSIELDLKCAHEQFGLNSIIFRPHNVYGELQNIADKYRNVVGIFMNQAINNQPFTVFGDGSQMRSYTYIDDISYVICKCINETRMYNNTFNIGSDTSYNILELGSLIATSFEIEPKFTHLPARNEVHEAVSSHEKIKSFLNLPPSTSLETGIRKMSDWVKSSGWRKPVGYENVEVMKNFPEGWKKYIN